MSDSDDDVPTLSAEAMAALQEFYAEQKEETEVADEKEPSMPQEDWQLSQFWYSEETATRLAKEVLSVIGENGSVACISCPTLYHKLREMKPSSCKAVILEYDNRFQSFGEDFIHYDYKDPLRLNPNLKMAFDLVVADPPFLSEECLAKTALTMRFLSNDKVILCTGAVMGELAERLLHVKPCTYLPSHTRNLANDFRCYANYTTTHLNAESDGRSIDHRSVTAHPVPNAASGS